MNEKAIKSIIKSTSKSVDSEKHTAQFIAQLAAWRKVSEKGLLEPDLSYGQIVLGDSILMNIRNIFERLESLPQLGENSKAFKVKGTWLDSMGENNLRKLCDFVSTGMKNQLLTYEDLIPAVFQSIAGRPILDEMSVPEDLSLFMLHLLNPGQGETLYIPLTESFNLARTGGHFFNNVFFESQSEMVWVWIANLLENTSIQAKVSDPINSPGWVEDGHLKEFDFALIKPTWGSRYKEEPVDWYGRFPDRKCLFGEVYQLYHALSQVKKRCVAIVPNVLLQKSAGGELRFKKELIKRNWLDAVIHMDTFYMGHNKVPYSILVLSKERQRQEVLFVDADDDSLEHYEDQITFLEGIVDSKKKSTNSPNGFKTFANVVEIYRAFVEGNTFDDFAYKDVKQDLIEESDFNLNVNRYIAPFMYKAITYSIEHGFDDLGNIADLIRPQAVKSKKETGKGREFFEISGSDIPSAGWINQPKSMVTVNEKNLRKAELQRIKGGDIILAVKGAIGKVGIVPIELKGSWLANQSYEIIRLKKDSPIKDSRVLYMYLKSDVANQLLEYLAYGTTIPTIQKRDLLSLRIMIPTEPEQNEIIKSFEEEVRLKYEIEKLEEKINKLNEKHWDVERHIYGE